MLCPVPRPCGILRASSEGLVIQLRLGNFYFTANAAIPTPSSVIDRQGPGGLAMSRTDTVTVEAIIDGTSQADITAKILALNAILITGFQDLVFYQDNGQPTAIVLYNNGSTSGVMLSKPTYPMGTIGQQDGGTYVNYVKVQFTASATYPLINAGTTLAGGVPFGGPGPVGGLPIAQVDTITPASVTVGNQFTLTIAPVAPATLPAQAAVSFTATLATVANVTAGLVAAVAASTAPMMRSLNPADTGATLTLTAINAGIPFTVTTSVAQGAGSAGMTLTDATTTPNFMPTAGVTTAPGQGTGWIQAPAVAFPGAPAGSGGASNLPAGAGSTTSSSSVGGSGGSGTSGGGGVSGGGGAAANLPGAAGSTASLAAANLPGAAGSTASPAAANTGGGGSIGARTGAGAGAGAAAMPTQPPGTSSGSLPAGVDPSTAAAMTSFTETLTFEGGGPKFIWLPAINGAPQKQQVYGQTTYRATQQGKAVGLMGFPPPPPPVFGADKLISAPKFTEVSPTRTGLGFQGYTVTWLYTFEDGSPLIGVPHVWRGN